MTDLQAILALKKPIQIQNKIKTRKKVQNLRLYQLDNEYIEPCGSAFIVAESVKEARLLAYHNEITDDIDWIDILPYWMKWANVTGLHKGIIGCGDDGAKQSIQALKNGIFTFIYDDCPLCRRESLIEYDAEKELFFCPRCEKYFKEM